MAHVTFIHGIDNKPAADVLHQQWLTFLADDPNGLDLATLGVSSSMVYWADVLYQSPIDLAEVAMEAATAKTAIPTAPSVEEAMFLTGLAAKLGGTLAAQEMTAGDARVERVPLPWPVKKKFLETFLRDVHHYLFDVEFSPRPGLTYFVRQEIRRRFVDVLATQVGQRGPHIVVSHSMGTVIAFDCLRNVNGCPSVDGLMTIGSPLGLDEIQDRLGPGYSSSDAFPAERLKGGWVNVFDRLDPVDGFDPTLADDYPATGQERVMDVEVVNKGPWRHAIQELIV